MIRSDPYDIQYPGFKDRYFIMLAAAVVLTIVSLVDYVAKNVEVLTKGGM